MSYFTLSELEAYSGLGRTDFKSAGTQMATADWVSFATFEHDAIAQIIDRWCNVPTFESHTVIEYKNGRGASGDFGEYLEDDYIYYLNEPATCVTSVEENVNYGTGSSSTSWATRAPHTETVTGDYEFSDYGSVPTISFNTNVPAKGRRNLRVTYTGGYPVGSPELEDIKRLALKMATKDLVFKKKVQEAQTARAQGTKDFAPMFDAISDGNVLTKDITMMLCRYRRYNLGGEIWR